MQRLALLGMHIANDPALCSRLARVLRFVADWHRPFAAASGPDAPSAVEQSTAAAEIAKVCNCVRPCHEEGTISKPGNISGHQSIGSFAIRNCLAYSMPMSFNFIEWQGTLCSKSPCMRLSNRQ